MSDDDVDLSAAFGPTITTHMDIMAFIWGPGINVAIFLAMYNYRKWWGFLHAMAGAFAFIFTLSTGLSILATSGMIPDDSPYLDSYPVLNTHYKIGITCLIVLSIQFALGLTAKIMQFSQGRSITIINLKKTHTISGYLVIILVKSNFYINIDIDQTFWGLIASDIAFFILVIAQKIFFPKMEQSSFNVSVPELRTVQSITELDSAKPYAVFANFVYSIEPLYYFHPAGF